MQFMKWSKRSICKSPDEGGGDGTILAGGDGGQAGDTTDTVLDGLFSAEEVQTRRDSLAAEKAEQEKLAAMNEDDRKKYEEEKAAKAAEDAKKNEGAPEKYEDFKLPEGAVMDKGILDDFQGIAKEFNFSQERAQKFIDFYTEKIVPRSVALQKEAWDATVQKMGEDAKADSEYGGTKFEENAKVAQRAFNSFATPELKQVMNDSGFGNHPEIIRLFYRIGLSMREDSFDMGGGQGGQSKDRLASLYPTMAGGQN